MAQRHLWLLDARSGRLVSDTLLSRMQPDASLATVWQPDGQDGYILRATNPEIDRLAEQRGGDSPFFRVPVGITSQEPKMVLSADGQYYYWWAKGYSPDRGEVSLLALAALEDGAAVFQEVPAGVSAIAASPVRQELFVLNSSLGTLTIIDLTGERAQVLVPVGKQPEQMTVSSDGSRAYVADAEADSILVVDLDSASVSYVLPLPGEPLSLATE
jgi:DNA-binding beta-propeller fold protein YncE